MRRRAQAREFVVSAAAHLAEPPHADEACLESFQAVWRGSAYARASKYTYASKKASKKESIHHSTQRYVSFTEIETHTENTTHNLAAKQASDLEKRLAASR